MEYTTLGSTGMEVSRLCLGCMGFSETGADWAIDREESRAIIERAIDLGITFFDTSNAYHDGESESILGDVVADYDRDRFVIATKGRFGSGREDRTDVGLSRRALDVQLRDSLDRLGVETIDLYQIHRWDDETPIEVTLRALNDAIRHGEVRYVGASSMWTSQFVESRHVAETLGLEPFRTMQPFYNAVYRERERDLLPYCLRENVGVMTWSPLMHGYLARPDDEWMATERGAGLADNPHPIREGNNPEVNRRVEELAAEYDASMAQIGLAWLLEKEWVDSPIVGTTSVEHLEEAVEALDIGLSSSDVEYLEEPYVPVRVSGWDGARERMGYED